VGNRCIVIGKHMNGIPDRAQSFLSVANLKTTAPEYFEEAAKLYEASLEFVPSYITRISLARALGFLGRFDEAGAQYAALFEQERLVDVSKGEVIKEVAQQRPQLLAAYLEWGVVELKAGLSGDRNVDRLARANAVFDLIVKFTKTTSRDRSETWWNCRYWQIRAWVDEGEYKNADVALRELERTTEASDQDKYGLRDQFKKLKSELAGKVFDNGPN
jgi:tetratricopeptide (TPR) repeat protein